MNLDVFNGDAFHLLPLSQAISLIPHQPTMIRNMGLFAEEGIPTLSMSIEMENNVLTLVPTAPRGAPGAVKGLNPRLMKNFNSVHLPQRCALYADEVLALRAFGKQTEEEVGMNRLKKKMAVCRRDLDVTIEYQRVNAIKGLVVDADGVTPLWNWFTEFGVTQQTKNFDFAGAGTIVRQKCVDVARMIEDELGGVMYSGIEAIVSPEFFDALVEDDDVRDTFKYQEGQALRKDLRRTGFEYGPITFKEYRGTVGGQRFMEVGCGYAYPIGVPGLFTTYYSPADHKDAVGQDGLPYYASLEEMPHGKGFDCLTQSNPLHLVTRPRSIVKLGRNASFN